ncbi:MAG: IPTL-CTERM sorting domain-containing protein [Candidatus Contendobacter sp.]|nr:IPTL-CTERM sorting domain-containing protein [Candidatus Contendobacter sp.]
MRGRFSKKAVVMGMVGLLWGVVASPVHGSVTANLSPNGDGFYLQWSLGLARYTWVDEAVGCPGDTNLANLLTETWIEAPPPGDRQSATISLASIPDGARITAVDIIVCQSSSAATGGTFQTFTRLNGANTDSGTNIVTSGGFGNRTATTQTITVSPVTKTGATTLEIGVLKTGSGNPLTNPAARSVNVYTLAGNVTYLASDLQVTKADSPDPVLAGQNLTYTLSVTNNGPDAILASEGILVQDTLPAGYAVTASSGDGSYNTGTNVWTISGGLASSATATIQLTVPVPSSEAQGTILSNTAAITSTHPDPDNTNDSDTATTTVNRSVDLSVTVADAPDPVTSGSSVAYTVTLTNNGPSDASGVAVNIAEIFPAGVTEGSGTPSTGTSWASPVWTVGTLAAGASATLTLNVNVAASAAPGTDVISVTATATGTESDPNTNDNAATARTSIQARAVAVAAPIPTLREWVLMLFSLLLGGLVWRQARRKGSMAA